MAESNNGKRSSHKKSGIFSGLNSSIDTIEQIRFLKERLPSATLGETRDDLHSTPLYGGNQPCRSTFKGLADHLSVVLMDQRRSGQVRPHMTLSRKTFGKTLFHTIAPSGTDFANSLFPFFSGICLLYESCLSADLKKFRDEIFEDCPFPGYAHVR